MNVNSLEVVSERIIHEDLTDSDVSINTPRENRKEILEEYLRSLHEIILALNETDKTENVALKEFLNQHSSISEILSQLNLNAQFLRKEQRLRLYTLVSYIMSINTDVSDVKLTDSLHDIIRRLAELYNEEIACCILFPVLESIYKDGEIIPETIELAMYLATFEPFMGLSVPFLLDSISEVKTLNITIAFRCLYLISENTKIATRLYFAYGLPCNLISLVLTSMDSLHLPEEIYNNFFYFLVNIITELEASIQTILLLQFLPQLKEFTFDYSKDTTSNIKIALIIMAGLIGSLRPSVLIPDSDYIIKNLRKLSLEGYDKASFIIASMINKRQADVNDETKIKDLFLDAMYIRNSGLNLNNHEAIKILTWTCKSFLSRGIYYWKFLLEVLIQALSEPGSSCSASAAFRILLLPSTTERYIETKLFRHWNMRILSHQWLLDEAIPQITTSFHTQTNLKNSIIEDYIVAIGHLLTVDGSLQLFKPHLRNLIKFWFEANALDINMPIRVLWPTLRAISRIACIANEIERNSLDTFILKCKQLVVGHATPEIRDEAGQCLIVLYQKLPECCLNYIFSNEYFCHF